MDESFKDSLHQSVNPWASDAFSASASSSILRLRFAETSGYRQTKREDVKEIADNLQKQSPSVQLFHYLRDISEKRRQLHQINLEIQCRLMDKETRDITHLDILESHISRLNALSSHLQRILVEKKELINRIQQPLVGDFLRVEATYHPQVQEVFALVVNCLAELSTNLDNIHWGSQLSLRDRRMAEVLDDIAKLLAQLQTGLQTIMTVRTLVTDL